LISPLIENFNLLSLYLENSIHLESEVSLKFQFENSTSFAANLFANLVNLTPVEFQIEIPDMPILQETPGSIYHYSIPTVKLAYPEPFTASASLMHGDLWFIHILIYQY
jgi:hypothetical protein